MEQISGDNKNHHQSSQSYSKSISSKATLNEVILHLRLEFVGAACVYSGRKTHHDCKSPTLPNQPKKKKREAYGCDLEREQKQETKSTRKYMVPYTFLI